jgi:hypothetical protein
MAVSKMHRLEGGMSTSLNAKERDIMTHALTGGTVREYRNHFVTGPGSDDYDVCMSLVERGFMERHERSWASDTIFTVTKIGRKAMK